MDKYPKKLTGRESTLGGVMLLVVGGFGLKHAHDVLNGVVTVTEECDPGRGRLLCEVGGVLFGGYGQASVGFMWVGGSALLIGIAFALLMPVPSKKVRVLGRQENYVEPQPKKREKPQTIQDVIDGEEPTEEFIEEFSEAQNAPMVSDEELERQALEQSTIEPRKF